MDLQKTGALIAALRRESGLTQKELAEKIGVTDKAISRWETGKGFPDVSCLKTLAEALNITIAELINGERVKCEIGSTASDRAILDILAYVKSMARKTLGMLCLIFGLGTAVLSPLSSVSFSRLPLSLLFSLSAAIIGAFLLFCRFSPPFNGARIRKLSRFHAGIVSFLALILALILEIIPCGVVLIFASGPNQRFQTTDSYFSLTPLGYANIFPLLTGILTIFLILVSLIILARRLQSPRLQSTSFLLTVLAFVFSLLPVMLFGIDYGNAVSAAISALLLLSTLFQIYINRRKPGKIDKNST